MKNNQTYAVDFLRVCLKEYLSAYNVSCLSSLVGAKENSVDGIMATEDWEYILSYCDEINDVFADAFRVCSECGGLMTEGFYDNGNYYCSEKCLPYEIGVWSSIVDGCDDRYSEHYGRESYWTDWGDGYIKIANELFEKYK